MMRTRQELPKETTVASQAISTEINPENQEAPSPLHPRLTAFLDTLESQLTGVSSGERREMREEARLHLLALVATHEELGESPEAAVEAAISSFGDTRQIARGIRQEAIRRRFGPHLSVRLILWPNVGAMAGLLFPILGAPLLLRGHDLTLLYPLLGAGFGLAAALRRRLLAGAFAGMMSAALILTLACALTQVIQQVCPFFMLGMRWTGRETEPACLLPALFLGALWGSRRRVTIPFALVTSVLAYVLTATLIEAQESISGRSYISPETAVGYLLLMALLWTNFGVFFGLLGALCHRAVGAVIRSIGSTTSAADARSRKA